MDRTVTVLAAILVAQLVLAAAMHLSVGGRAEEDTTAPLAALQAQAVDAVRIIGPEGKAVKLARDEQGWALPDSGGFPADQAQVERLLQVADGFPGRLPVARSESARSRFEVGADQYQRRLVFQGSDEQRATLFVGESAGPGEVYVRAAGRDMIYEVSFARTSAPVRASEWFDRSVAGVPRSDLNKIVLDEFTLQRDDRGWAIAGREASVKQAALDGFLRGLAQPAFKAVPRAEPPKTTPTLDYTLVTKKGEEIRIRYYPAGEAGKRPRFYRDDQPWAYRAPAAQLAKLRKQSPDTLLATSDPGGNKAGGGSSSEPTAAGQGKADTAS